MNKFKHSDLTEQIIAAAIEVISELGAGFLESVYEKALLIALREKGLNADSQMPVSVIFRGEVVGDFFADLIVNSEVIVELKVVKSLLPIHQAQLINYLKATGLQVGLLINFSKPKLEFKRVYT
jgi:GxxExxY protein